MNENNIANLPSWVKTGKRESLTAVERDGFDLRVMTVTCVLRDNGVILLDAIKAACSEYVRTEEGKDTLSYTCGDFNLADFDIYVPNSLCIKHGFYKENSSCTDDYIDWDHQLIDVPENEEGDEE